MKSILHELSWDYTLKWFKNIFSKSDDVLQEAAPEMIIAVDFDGTCVKDKFPDVGPSMPGAVQTLHALINRGHKIILWTCRENIDEDKQYLDHAVEWFEENNIELYGVNETPLEDDFRSSGGRKVFAHIYIDDRSFGGFPGWHKIHQEITGMPLVSF